MSLAEDVLSDLKQRQSHYQYLHAQMEQVSQVYNNRARVALPDAADDANPTVPNLLAQGIEQLGGRISSVLPQPAFASRNPGQRASDRRAATAGRVVTAWWAENDLASMLGRRARHLVAYGINAVIIGYDPEDGHPTWTLRDPRTCYPSVDIQPGKVCKDATFAYKRSGSWLKRHGYGAALEYLGQRDPVTVNVTKYTLIEHIGHESRSLVLAGTNPNSDYATPFVGNVPMNANAVLLEHVEGDDAPRAFVSSRLALDEVGGQFDTMLGMYALQARLMALEELAVEKGIFPDTYLVSRPNEVGRFIDGPYDGRTGKVNVIAGGDIKEVQSQPGYQTNGMIDRLERSQRLTGGIPSEFGGESGTNIRTGRRGDAVLSAVIDFPVADAQRILAKALEEENEAAIKMARHFDNGAERVLMTGFGNDLRSVVYVADDVFRDGEEHSVTYPVTGADMNSLLIGLGQRVGLGIMSKATAASLDPFIASPELEHDQIISEGLEQSLVAGIQQQAVSGALPPLVVSKVMTLVRNDKMELAEALVKVTEDAAKAAEEAAAAQQQGPPTADQMMAGAAQQGLAGAVPGAIAGPSQDQQNFSNMLGALRRPVMGVAPRTTVDTRGNAVV